MTSRELNCIDRRRGQSKPTRLSINPPTNILDQHYRVAIEAGELVPAIILLERTSQFTNCVGGLANEGSCKQTLRRMRDQGTGRIVLSFCISFYQLTASFYH